MVIRLLNRLIFVVFSLISLVCQNRRIHPIRKISVLLSSPLLFANFLFRLPRLLLLFRVRGVDRLIPG